jgi:hypothetical protein
MADFFLGSSLRLHDPQFVDMPASLKHQRQAVGAGLARRALHTTVLNRLGVSSETSGELRFRCHVVKSSPDLAVSPASMAASSAAAGTLTSQGGQAGIGAGLTLSRGRSVGDILRSTQRLGASGSLASLSPSLSGLGLGLGLGSSVGASGGLAGQQTPSGREADSAALSRRAEQLLAQAKSKVAALSALGALSSSSSAGSGSGAGARSESKEYAPASSSSSSSLAESKEQGLGLGLRSGAGAGAGAGQGRRGAKARYSDDEGEGDQGEAAGLLRR